MRSPQAIEARIRRMQREIAEIDEYFYGPRKDQDRDMYMGMLERKRDDMVRSAVLQLHTGIEDLLDYLIISKILETSAQNRGRRMSTPRGRALGKMLHGAGSIGFDMKLNFAVALRLLPTKAKERLMQLNTMRNRCSHNWLLNVPVRRGRRPRQTKPPLLLYEGHDLHDVTALKDFIAEYGTMYASLFGKYCDVEAAFRKP